MFEIRMGIPQMKQLWDSLSTESLLGTLSKENEILYKKWGKTLYFLSQNPKHPGLQTHEIVPLSRRYGLKVWQSYLENNTPNAGRLYWVYGPAKKCITIIGLEPHPEDKKSAGYAKVKLSEMGEEI